MDESPEKPTTGNEDSGNDSNAALGQCRTLSAQLEKDLQSLTDKDQKDAREGKLSRRLKRRYQQMLNLHLASLTFMGHISPHLDASDIDN